MNNDDFITGLFAGAISVIVGIIIGLLLFIFFDCANAQTLTIFDRSSNVVTLRWDANTEPDMAAYTIYVHTPDTVRPVLTVPHPVTEAEFMVSPLYYYERIGFTLTATDAAGNESGHSNQVDGVFSAAPALVGDVTGDGRVDVEDAEVVRASLGAYPYYVGWREAADLDGSRKIDVSDIEALRTKYGNR